MSTLPCAERRGQTPHWGRRTPFLPWIPPCAAITASLSGYLAAGHLETPSQPDLLACAIIQWLLVNLMAGGDRRLSV